MVQPETNPLDAAARTAEGSVNMYCLRKYDQGMYILGFSIWRMSFEWFTDQGEWFINIHVFRRRKTHVLSFSSGGNYFLTVTEGEHRGRSHRKEE